MSYAIKLRLLARFELHSHTLNLSIATCCFRHLVGLAGHLSTMQAQPSSI